MRQMDFSTWDIQTGPFAAHSAPYVRKIFHLFHLHTGEPILITPEGQLSEKGILPTSKLDDAEGFQCQDHSTGTIQSRPFTA